MARPTDIVCARPRILFVGINPSATSGQVGHHFAGKGNPFYRLLFEAGLVPEVIEAEADHRLPEWRYALVNLCARPTKTAAELKRPELERGRKKLVTKIQEMQPEIVALVGVTLYPVVCGRTGKPGPGAKPDTIEGARVFVVPNPSGLNASFPTFETKLPWFRKLRAFADQLGAGKPPAKST